MPTIGSEVSVSTANGYITEFISDYFNTGKAPVKSMIMDAQLIRDYLADNTIENVKFMLGARDETVNGQTTQIFTLIVAGYDSNGDYVLTSSGNVLDHSDPCPDKCPTGGTAANDTIS